MDASESAEAPAADHEDQPAAAPEEIAPEPSPFAGNV